MFVFSILTLIFNYQLAPSYCDYENVNGTLIFVKSGVQPPTSIYVFISTIVLMIGSISALCIGASTSVDIVMVLSMSLLFAPIFAESGYPCRMWEVFFVEMITLLFALMPWETSRRIPIFLTLLAHVFKLVFLLILVPYNTYILVFLIFDIVLEAIKLIILACKETTPLTEYLILLHYCTLYIITTVCVWRA